MMKKDIPVIYDMYCMECSYERVCHSSDYHHTSCPECDGAMFIKFFIESKSSRPTIPTAGNIAFTVTAPNLRIDVDSPLKLDWIKTLIKHAEKQFDPKNKSSVIDLEDDSNE